ncbi:MAG: hypothetical protein FJ170_01430 [Gammaproteobacteria bacterium]|nr:hypothetical protein [Gammaproteobacteria bacterium]
MNAEREADALPAMEMSPREILVRDFEVRPGDLAIRGGWGFSQDDACVIDRNDPAVTSGLSFDARKVQSLFIQLRIYEELITSRPVGQGFAGIGWRLTARNLSRDRGRTYDQLVFEIQAFPEADWDALKAEWEGPNGHSSPEFDIDAHKAKRQQRMVRFMREFWFDITTCENLELFGIPFPWLLAGLSRGGLNAHEVSTPGLGHSIAYDGENASATIFIYDGGRSDIPDDPLDPLVMEHFEVVRNDIRIASERGIYQNLREGRPYATGNPEAGVGFLCGEFQFEAGGETRSSLVFLTTYRGRFLKGRYTGPASDDFAFEARSFMDGVAGLLWPELRPAAH